MAERSERGGLHHPLQPNIRFLPSVAVFFSNACGAPALVPLRPFLWLFVGPSFSMLACPKYYRYATGLPASLLAAAADSAPVGPLFLLLVSIAVWGLGFESTCLAWRLTGRACVCAVAGFRGSVL